MITHHRLESGGKSLPYRIRRRKGMRHCYIHIIDGEVELRCPPQFPLSDAESLLRQRLGWIEKKLGEYAEKKSLYDPFELFVLKGKSYPVEFFPAGDKKSSIAFREGSLIIHSPTAPDREGLKRTYEELYRSYCHKELVPRVHEWSRSMGLVPSRITFRQAKTRWGSCSSRDSLSLNLYLAALPEALSDYVIVHELAHIRHKNHSRNFWSLVEKYIPDWKERRKSLRKYEGLLG